MGDSDNMTNASVKPALKHIEEMEQKIEDDVAEIKTTLEELKNGNNNTPDQDQEQENGTSIEMSVCNSTKKEMQDG